jgi:hypothetical protein
VEKCKNALVFLGFRLIVAMTFAKMTRADRGYLTPADRLDSPRSNLWQERPAMTVVHATTSKVCRKCGEAKPFADYYAHPRSPDGFFARCKVCAKADGRARQDRLWRQCKVAIRERRERAIRLDSFGPETRIIDDAGRDWAWCFVLYRAIPGFPGYLAGTDGSVWTEWSRGCNSVRTGFWVRMKPSPNRFGYGRVNLRADGNSTLIIVSNVIARTFLGSPVVGDRVLHRDGNTANDTMINLRWGTAKDNSADSIEHGTWMHGTKNSKAKLDDDKIREIRRRVGQGERRATVAECFGLNVSTVGDIVRRKLWKHVT